jgi:hypothetical protein
MRTQTISSLSWNDRLALIMHYNPSNTNICSSLGVTLDELHTARELQNSGHFCPTQDIDVAAYSDLFEVDDAPDIKVGTIAHVDHGKTTLGVTLARIGAAIVNDPPATATKKVTKSKKRGRKGDNIAKAFAAIPQEPVPVDEFATTYNVSVAVLRQYKRFDGPDKARVRVVKNKESGVLMIWREAEAETHS